MENYTLTECSPECLGSSPCVLSEYSFRIESFQGVNSTEPRRVGGRVFALQSGRTIVLQLEKEHLA